MARLIVRTLCPIPSADRIPVGAVATAGEGGAGVDAAVGHGRASDCLCLVASWRTADLTRPAIAPRPGARVL